MASGGQRDVQIESFLGRTVESEFWTFTRSGKTQHVSEEYDLGDAGTASLTLSNPAGSGVTAVVLLSPEARTASYARVYDTFSTLPSGGTDVEIQNQLIDTGNGSPDVGEVTARRGDTFTAASTHTSRIVEAGQGGLSVGGHANFLALPIEPDRRIVIELEKLASGPNEATINALWFEVDQVFSEDNGRIRLEEFYD